MIVETSALVAIVRGEPDAAQLAGLAVAADRCLLSAASFLETAVVIDGARNPVLSRRFDDLIKLMELEIRPVTQEQAEIARAAYRDFGKGSGHPAGLNFGDCLSYALAKVTGEPLLCKGNDFIHTDLTVCP